MSRCQGVKVSRCQGFKVSRCQGVKVSRWCYPAIVPLGYIKSATIVSESLEPSDSIFVRMPSSYVWHGKRCRKRNRYDGYPMCGKQKQQFNDLDNIDLLDVSPGEVMRELRELIICKGGWMDGGNIAMLPKSHRALIASYSSNNNCSGLAQFASKFCNYHTGVDFERKRGTFILKLRSYRGENHSTRVTLVPNSSYLADHGNHGNDGNYGNDGNDGNHGNHGNQRREIHSRKRSPSNIETEDNCTGPSFKRRARDLDHVDNSGNLDPQNPENEHSVDPQNMANIFPPQPSSLANDGYEEQFDPENLENEHSLSVVEMANNMYEQLSRELTEHGEDTPLPEDHLCQENENVFLDPNVNSISLIENHGETVSLVDDEVPSSTLGHEASHAAERLGDQTDIGEDDNHSHLDYGVCYWEEDVCSEEDSSILSECSDEMYDSS